MLMSIPMPKHQVQYEIKDKEKDLKKQNKTKPLQFNLRKATSGLEATEEWNAINS